MESSRKSHVNKKHSFLDQLTRSITSNTNKNHRARNHKNRSNPYQQKEFVIQMVRKDLVQQKRESLATLESINNVFNDPQQAKQFDKAMNINESQIKLSSLYLPLSSIEDYLDEDLHQNQGYASESNTPKMFLKQLQAQDNTTLLATMSVISEAVKSLKQSKLTKTELNDCVAELKQAYLTGDVQPKDNEGQPSTGVKTQSESLLKMIVEDYSKLKLTLVNQEETISQLKNNLTNYQQKNDILKEKLSNTKRDRNILIQQVLEETQKNKKIDKQLFMAQNELEEIKQARNHELHKLHKDNNQLRLQKQRLQNQVRQLQIDLSRNQKLLQISGPKKSFSSVMSHQTILSVVCKYAGDKEIVKLMQLNRQFLHVNFQRFTFKRLTKIGQLNASINNGNMIDLKCTSPSPFYSPTTQNKKKCFGEYQSEKATTAQSNNISALFAGNSHSSSDQQECQICQKALSEQLKDQPINKISINHKMLDDVKQIITEASTLLEQYAKHNFEFEQVRKTQQIQEQKSNKKSGLFGRLWKSSNDKESNQMPQLDFQSPEQLNNLLIKFHSNLCEMSQPDDPDENRVAVFHSNLYRIFAQFFFYSCYMESLVDSFMPQQDEFMYQITTLKQQVSILTDQSVILRQSENKLLNKNDQLNRANHETDQKNLDLNKKLIQSQSDLVKVRFSVQKSEKQLSEFNQKEDLMRKQIRSLKTSNYDQQSLIYCLSNERDQLKGAIDEFKTLMGSFDI